MASSQSLVAPVRQVRHSDLEANVDVIFHSRHRRIGTPLREHALEKLRKVERLDPQLRRIDVEISHEAFSRHENERVELTAQTSQGMLRAQGQSRNAWQALDAAIRCLLEQVRRNADRRRAF